MQEDETRKTWWRHSTKKVTAVWTTWCLLKKHNENSICCEFCQIVQSLWDFFLNSTVMVSVVKMKKEDLCCVCFVRSLIVFFPSLGWYAESTLSTSENLVGRRDPGSSTVSWCYTRLQDSRQDSPFCSLSPLEALHPLMATGKTRFVCWTFWSFKPRAILITHIWMFESDHKVLLLLILNFKK